VPPRLLDTPLDVVDLLKDVTAPGHGATVLFVGTVRNQHDGRPVRAIDYTAYRVMAEERLRTIERELAATHGARVRIAHRLGELEVGEPSVAIAISAPHRAAAYDANREALERIKREVPIWKRELYADGGSSWREVEPLQQDH
jgi:molybdopterin synthase catalytic subunit